MTQEEKQLLLKDLSARLLYGVKVDHFGTARELLGIIPSSENVMVGYDINDYEDSVIEDIKPYLRPMSSMTEEEKKEMHEKLSPTGTAIYKEEGILTPVSHYGDWILYEYMSRIIDWLNAHHFDYRGLIPMGLAIAVTEENNPYKE